MSSPLALDALLESFAERDASKPTAPQPTRELTFSETIDYRTTPPTITRTVDPSLLAEATANPERFTAPPVVKVTLIPSKGMSARSSARSRADAARLRARNAAPTVAPGATDTDF